MIKELCKHWWRTNSINRKKCADIVVLRKNEINWKCKCNEKGCAGIGSVSTEKCGAANTERGYAGIGLQTYAERDV